MSSPFDDPDRVPTPPAADIDLDAEIVTSLLGRAVPEAGVDLTAISWDVGMSPQGEGWDNILWPVGRLAERELVLRVPRRDSARELLRHERAVLRHLERHDRFYPLGLPEPLATAGDALLMPWMVGTTAAESSPSVRSAVARDLAEMLAVIHGTPAPFGPVNPVRGVPVASRDNAFTRDLGLPTLEPAQRRRARQRWDTGLAAARWEGPALLLHGDPHPGNVVVPAARSTSDTRDQDGRSRLIDWGDTTVGDPASDLGGLLLHDPSDSLLDLYREHATWVGIEDDAVWDALAARAWAWGSRMALSLLTAYSSGHPLGTAGSRLLDVQR